MSNVVTWWWASDIEGGGTEGRWGSTGGSEGVAYGVGGLVVYRGFAVWGKGSDLRGGASMSLKYKRKKKLVLISIY